MGLTFQMNYLESCLLETHGNGSKQLSEKYVNVSWRYGQAFCPRYLEDPLHNYPDSILK